MFKFMHFLAGVPTMAQDGVVAEVEKAKVEFITDANGVTYKIGKFLGRGAEGRTFQGEVVAPIPDKLPFGLQEGSIVAIKQQVVKEMEALEQEFDLLAKEGSLYGSKRETVQNVEYMYVAIPILTGKSLREQMYDIDPDPNSPVAVRGKRDLTADEKKNISYSLLKDYSAQHLLSILHVDIKPDNIMYDPKTGKVKVIDFGNSYDLDLFLTHPKGFQSPGALYAAQENYQKGSKNECSVKADLYAIGMLLASVWTNKNYEGEAKEVGKDWNMALNARETLDDILGPNAVKPQDMPQDLWDTIRHLTALDPADRPENIGLANGVSTSDELKGIAQAQASIDSFRQNTLDTIGKDLRSIADETEKSKYDVLIKLPKAMSDPTQKYKQLKASLEELRIIEAKIQEIDGRAAPKSDEAATRRAAQRKAAVDEFNKALSEIAKSPDSDYQKLFKSVSIKDSDPLVKMNEISKIKDDVLTQVLSKAASEGSLYVFVENQVNEIIKGSKEASTIRRGIDELRGDMVVLATLDPSYAKQCQGIVSTLNKMIDNLDTLRTNEAHILQGKVQRTDKIEPVVLAEQYQEPAQTVQERKRGAWKQFKHQLKKMLLNKITANAPQGAEPSNPLSLTRLASLLSSSSENNKKDREKVPEKPKETENVNDDVLSNIFHEQSAHPSSLNPLMMASSHHPLPSTPTLANKTTIEFVDRSMKEIADLMQSLALKNQSIQIDDSIPEHAVHTVQAQKEFYALQINALSQVESFLSSHQGMNLQDDKLVKALEECIQEQSQRLEKVKEKFDRNSGDVMMRDTQILLRDMQSHLKPDQPSNTTEQRQQHHQHH